MLEKKKWEKVKNEEAREQLKNVGMHDVSIKFIRNLG